MDWQAVFSDINAWMQESNRTMQQHPITTDEYWTWLVRSIGDIGNKYNNHPLVLNFLEVLIKFQDDNYKQVVGREVNVKK
jgi:hypothetical protein